MADHLVRCMATPPFSGLTTDTSRGTAGTCRDTPPLSASLGWASRAPASAQTHFSTVRCPYIQRRNFPHGGGVAHGVLQWQPCPGSSPRHVGRFPVSMCISIYNGILPLSREIHAAPGALQDPDNTFSSGGAAPDWDKSGAKQGGPLMMRPGTGRI